MALDKATETLLADLAASGAKPFHQMEVPEARQAFAGLVDAYAGAAPPIETSTDLEIPGPNGPIGLRHYRPRDADGPLPVIVFFHGGGWVVGDLDTHDTLCRRLCHDTSMAVIAVDYRLAPEHPFPSGLRDCVAATKWIATHASTLELDGRRLAVCGDSAGGNLAAVVAQRLRRRVAFQVLVFPSVDMRPIGYPSRDEFGGGEFLLSMKDMEWFADHLITKPRQIHTAGASPTTAKRLHRLPPALVITAGNDPLRDEATCYADKLAQAGVPTDQHCFDTTIHGFVLFGAAIPAASEAIDLIADRLRDAFWPTWCYTAPPA